MLSSAMTRFSRFLKKLEEFKLITKETTSSKSPKRKDGYRMSHSGVTIKFTQTT